MPKSNIVEVRHTPFQVKHEDDWYVGHFHQPNPDLNAIRAIVIGRTDHRFTDGEERKVFGVPFEKALDNLEDPLKAALNEQLGGGWNVDLRIKFQDNDPSGDPSIPHKHEPYTEEKPLKKAPKKPQRQGRWKQRHEQRRGL